MTKREIKMLALSNAAGIIEATIDNSGEAYEMDAADLEVYCIELHRIADRLKRQAEKLYDKADSHKDNLGHGHRSYLVRACHRHNGGSYS